MKNTENRKVIIILITFILLLFLFVISLAFLNYFKEKKKDDKIISDMSRVYINSEFVDVEREKKPFDKSILKEHFIWCGAGIPDEDIYVFTIIDSNGISAIGYSDQDGNVIFDSYAGYYYRNDSIRYFLDSTDFLEKYPDVHYYAPEIDPINDQRLVLTKDCTSFDSYKKASTIAYDYVDSGGYPGIYLGLERTDEETVKSINELLQNANFDLYVTYNKISGDFVKARKASDLEWDNPDFEEPYYPFGKTYSEAILGE